MRSLIACCLSATLFLQAPLEGDDGADVYVFAYPLVTMEMTRRVMTSMDRPNEGFSPMGHFANARQLANASFKAFTTPNADTLYSNAWLDLSSGPYLFQMPDEGGRYYLMPILDAWTNVIADPGTRTVGIGRHLYLIAGPSWQGAVPAAVDKVFRSPTNLVWILGRTFTTAEPEDYKIVRALQDQYKLWPLEKTTPASNGGSASRSTPVRAQVNQMDARTFFDLFTSLLPANPPLPEDAPIVAKMERLGIIPGKKLSEQAAKNLNQAPTLGLQQIREYLEQLGQQSVNGWRMTLKTGRYGTDYLQRAAIAYSGLGANLPQDAVYLMTGSDSNGQPLNGANNYLIHFTREQVPPVGGFWSLTMYDPQLFFVPNPLDRFSLGAHGQIQYHTDGALDLYIQHNSPGANRESNWLPAPDGPFVLVLRLYWPDASVLNGLWTPPIVQNMTTSSGGS